jgi:hypothetical protein
MSQAGLQGLPIALATRAVVQHGQVLPDGLAEEDFPAWVRARMAAVMHVPASELAVDWGLESDGTSPPQGWLAAVRVSVMRQRAGMAAMLANVSNTAQQITGFSIASIKVKPKYLLGAMADYVKAPKEPKAPKAPKEPKAAVATEPAATATPTEEPKKRVVVKKTKTVVA